MRTSRVYLPALFIKPAIGIANSEFIRHFNHLSWRQRKRLLTNEVSVNLLAKFKPESNDNIFSWITHHAL